MRRYGNLRVGSVFFNPKPQFRFSVLKKNHEFCDHGFLTSKNIFIFLQTKSENRFLKCRFLFLLTKIQCQNEKNPKSVDSFYFKKIILNRFFF